MSSKLSLDHVCCGYARGLQLAGISAKLRSGDVCAILGPNGAGKTTLLRAIAGLLPISGGSIAVNDSDLRKLSALERARAIAYVPQTAVVPSGLSVAEALSIASYPQGYQPWLGSQASTARVAKMLARFRLEGFAARQAHTLSGGEQRRFLLAQGLMQLGATGGLLLLDEPTAFLDPPARRSIAQTAAQIARQEKRVVIMVLHEPELALEFATHLLLLRAGRPIAFGSSANLAGSALLNHLYDEDSLEELTPVEAA